MCELSFRAEYESGGIQTKYFDADSEGARIFARRMSKQFDLSVYVVRAVREAGELTFRDTGQIVYYAGRESYREGEFPTGKKG